MKQLYPIQAVHCTKLVTSLEKHGHALDGSATGTGKTICAAEIAAQYKRPVFVVGMKATLDMWRDELRERKISPLDVINYEMIRRGNTKWGKWVGHNMWQWKLPKDTIIIHDECQKYQGAASLNSRLLIAAKPYWNLMLSATAAESPVDMRATGYILGLHSLRDYVKWAKQHGCYVNQWGKMEFRGEEEVMQKLHNQIFPEHGSRLTLEDMADHFQETQIITTPIRFGKELETIYTEMENELSALAEIMTSDSKHPAAERLVAQLRARQKVELLKVPFMLEMIEDLLKEGRSIVVFVNFDATIEALSNRFPNNRIIRGSQLPAVRTRARDDFQNNSCPLLICNVQAGGVSLNLHDIHGGHPRTAIISPSWNAKDILQTIGRVHRAGGKTPSQQHILFAAATVEQTVEKSVREKIKNISLFNDGKI